MSPCLLLLQQLNPRSAERLEVREGGQVRLRDPEEQVVWFLGSGLQRTEITVLLQIMKGLFFFWEFMWLGFRLCI